MKTRTITIQGKTYSSIKEAARAYGLTSAAIIARREAGWTDEDYKKGHRPRKKYPSHRAVPVTINKIEYPSYTEAAKAYNISLSAFIYRLDAGWTDEDFKRGGRGRKGGVNG